MREKSLEHKPTQAVLLTKLNSALFTSYICQKGKKSSLPESAVDNLQVSQTASSSGAPPLGLCAPVVCKIKDTYITEHCRFYPSILIRLVNVFFFHLQTLLSYSNHNRLINKPVIVSMCVCVQFLATIAHNTDHDHRV